LSLFFDIEAKSLAKIIKKYCQPTIVIQV